MLRPDPIFLFPQHIHLSIAFWLVVMAAILLLYGLGLFCEIGMRNIK